MALTRGLDYTADPPPPDCYVRSYSWVFFKAIVPEVTIKLFFPADSVATFDQKKGERANFIFIFHVFGDHAYTCECTNAQIAICGYKNTFSCA